MQTWIVTNHQGGFDTFWRRLPHTISLLEGKGFEPSVPRKAPGGVVVSLVVRADFSVGGGLKQSDMSPLETLVVSRGTDGSKSCADLTSTAAEALTTTRRRDGPAIGCGVTCRRRHPPRELR
jgi:hypothetical protein